MGKKIIRIFICSIMICLLFQPFVSAEIIGKKKNFDGEVSIWALVDKRFNNINNLYIYVANVHLGDNSGFIDFKFSDIIFEKTDTTHDICVFNFELKLSGDLKINNKKIDLKLGGQKPIIITGKIELNRSDMEIKNFTSQISGLCKLRFKIISFNPFYFLSIPILFSININYDSSSPFKLTNIPTFIENYFCNNSTHLSVN